MVARTDSGYAADGAVSDSDLWLSVRWKKVRFLGGWGMVTSPGYPTTNSTER